MQQEYPSTPVTDRMERSFGGNPGPSALTHAVQLARALEAERTWLVDALQPFLRGASAPTAADVDALKRVVDDLMK